MVSLSSLALNFTSNSFNKVTYIANDEVVLVNTERSTVRWKGEKVTGFHEELSTLKCKSYV